MKATTASGLSAAQRRFLVALRDGIPYRLPAAIGLRSETLQPHLLALARGLAKMGLVVPTVEHAHNERGQPEERLLGGVLTDRGAAVAKGLL